MTAIFDSAESDYLATRNLHAGYSIVFFLEKSKETLERLVEGLPILFAILDTKGNILKGNRVLASLFKVEVENLSGLSVLGLCEESSKRKLLSFLNGIEEKQTPFYFRNEMSLLKLGGVFFDLSVTFFERGFEKNVNYVCLVGTEVQSSFLLERLSEAQLVASSTILEFSKLTKVIDVLSLFENCLSQILENFGYKFCFAENKFHSGELKEDEDCFFRSITANLQNGIETGYLLYGLKKRESSAFANGIGSIFDLLVMSLEQTLMRIG